MKKNRKWIIATVVLVVIGVASTVYQLSQKEPPAAPADEMAATAGGEAEAAADQASKEDRGDPTALYANLVVPDPPNTPSSESTSGAPAKLALTLVQGPAKRIRREGTKLVDVEGTIVREGSRYQLQLTDNSEPMLLLENLILQRIDILQEGQGQGASAETWKLTGTVTEFRSANFLLLERAVQVR